VRGSYQKQTATFGLVIRFPFLIWTQRAHAAAADAQAVHARKEAQAAKDQVSLEAIKLHRTLRQLEAAREVAQLQSELARGDLDTAEARTEAGNATLRELQSATLQAGERSAALLDAEFEVERVQLQLMRETGDLEKWAMSHN
jgi:outer membrane protein TolC